MNTNIVNPVIYDYNTNEKIIKELCQEYPFLSAKICGTTCLGRHIYSLTLGNQKNSVLYVGGTHGCEWLTSLELLLFTEKLCHSIKHNHPIAGVNISKAFTELGVTIVPCLNPDGVEIAVHGEAASLTLRKFLKSMHCQDYSKYSANAMGVDINHNFNAGWEVLKKIEQENGITKPCPRQFGGEWAESELETKAITKLCRLNNFRQCLSMHSQGEEIFWRYGETLPPHSQMMAKILSNSCGYKLVENDGLASHGGLKDWFINEFNHPAFTFEIGKGENPLPQSDLLKIHEKIEEALTIFCLM